MQTTTDKPLVPAEGAARPEFIRYPKPGQHCPYTGASRAWLYSLASAGHIKTVCIRARGKARGVRLIDYDSLIAYIRSQADGEKTTGGGR